MTPPTPPNPPADPADPADSRRDLHRRATPFMIALGLAVALTALPLPNESRNNGLTIVAVGSAIALILGAFLVPWWRFHHWVGAVPPLAAVAVVALLRHAAGAVESGFAPMLLLPVVWMALYRTRADVMVAVSAVTVAMVAPILVLGPPEYPPTEWRRTGVLVAIALFVGLRTHQLVTDVRAREAYQRGVMDSVAEGIVTLDRHGRVRLANPSAGLLLRHHEITGKDIHAVVHDDSGHTSGDCPLTTPIREGRRHHLPEDEFLRADGSRFSVEAWTTPIEYGERLDGAVVTFSDITERSTVARLKDEFISVVGHELRTPLTSIRGSLGLMAGGVFGPLPSEAQRMLTIATTNTDRLVRLINEILNVQRMESGKAPLNRRSVAISELLGFARATMESMAQETQVSISVQADENLVVDADPDRVLQTLTNLLSNAIKFSPPGSDVLMRSSLRDNRVVIDVIDHGRGIPAASLKTIFDRFEQVDATDSREWGGSGLGLAIARGIVRQHGGELTVTSTEGKGSTFSFDLPVADPGSPASSEAGIILVCDADPEHSARSAAELSGWGYEVIEAGSREEAVEVARTRPDLIVFNDRRAPSGVTASLGELRAVTDAPVLVIVAFDGERGSSLRLAKPWSPESLAHLINPGSQTLIIEDDPKLSRRLADVVEKQGASTEQVDDLAKAGEILDRITPNLIVVDLGHPGSDGNEIVDELRERGKLRKAVIVVYTASQKPDYPVGEELERRAISLIARMMEVGA